MTPEELYEKNEKLVYGAMHKHFPDRAYDEDMLQEARLALWEACLEYNPDKGRLSTFVYLKIRQRILQIIRMEKAQKRFADVLSLSEPLKEDPRAGTLEDVLVCEDNVEWHDWEGGMNALSERDRQILLLYCAGHQQEEIAARYDTSKANISRIIQKTRRLLKKYL